MLYPCLTMQTLTCGHENPSVFTSRIGWYAVLTVFPWQVPVATRCGLGGML